DDAAGKPAAAPQHATAPAERPEPGPRVTPVQVGSTRSVAFVVPARARWWGELSFSCYRAAMSLTGTRSAGEAFERISPTVPSAMAAGGIDLGADLAALGIFECGGSPCLYVAAHLAKPERMPDVLAKLLPGVPQQ